MSDATSAATSPTEPIISVQNVSFGYKRNNTVLEDINFDVPQGQSLTVLGYNGVGKTTLLHIITGLLRPKTGRAIINANLVPSMRDVFQMNDQSCMAAELTVRENIKFRAMLLNMPLDMERINDEPMIKAFQLDDHLDKKVSKLSSGLRKRAGLAAGLIFDPHVIMLDEPTNAIDPLTRQLMTDLMKQLKAAGRTVLTVTHDLDYCWHVADRAIVLDDKHLVKDVMISDFRDYREFEEVATLGKENRSVDFGLSTSQRWHRD